MASVADELRRATLAKVLALSVEERLALAASLAEADLDLYCAANGVSRGEGRRVFQRQRQAGRLASRVMAGTTE